jgi:Glycosyl transferase family 2
LGNEIDPTKLHAWIDKFAEAPNEALSYATGDYIFWLNADDVVRPAERVKLLALLAGLRRPTMGHAAGAMPPLSPPSPAQPSHPAEPRGTRLRAPVIKPRHGD